jgi:hypothetical protein
MQNFNKQQPRPKINIPKTPQQLFLKKVDTFKQPQPHPHPHPQITLEVLKPVKTVKHIDELYSKTFLDEYFHL